MILVQNLNFHACLFLQRKHFGILLNNVLEKKPTFLNYKKVIFKKSKNLHFCKRGQPMIFVKNLNSHASLFLQRKHFGILLNNVLETKPTFLNYKKVIFKKSKNLHFSKAGQPMILVKNRNFYASLFFQRKHQVILLNNILEREPAFLNYKKVISKKSKYLQFCKGVNP